MRWHGCAVIWDDIRSNRSTPRWTSGRLAPHGILVVTRRFAPQLARTVAGTAARDEAVRSACGSPIMSQLRGPPDAGCRVARGGGRRLPRCTNTRYDGPVAGGTRRSERSGRALRPPLAASVALVGWTRRRLSGLGDREERRLEWRGPRAAVEADPCWHWSDNGLEEIDDSAAQVSTRLNAADRTTPFEQQPSEQMG